MENVRLKTGTCHKLKKNVVDITKRNFRIPGTLQVNIVARNWKPISKARVNVILTKLLLQQPHFNVLASFMFGIVSWLFLSTSFWWSLVWVFFWLSPWTYWDKTYVPGIWHHLILCYSNMSFNHLRYCWARHLHLTWGFFSSTINIHQLFVIYLFSRKVICQSVWSLWSLTFVNARHQFCAWSDESFSWNLQISVLSVLITQHIKYLVWFLCNRSVETNALRNNSQWTWNLNKICQYERYVTTLSTFKFPVVHNHDINLNSGEQLFLHWFRFWMFVLENQSF